MLCHGREESDVTLLQRIHFEDLTLNYSRPKYPYYNILYIYLIHMSGVVFKIYGNTYLARLHYGLYTCMKPRMRSSNVLRLAATNLHTYVVYVYFKWYIAYIIEPGTIYGQNFYSTRLLLC